MNFEKDLIPVQLCVVSGYSAGWHAGLANIRDEDLMICCTKSSSITQAGSELDFLLSPRATAGHTDNRDKPHDYQRDHSELFRTDRKKKKKKRFTDVHVCQYPVNELTEDLSRFLHRLVVLSCAGTTTGCKLKNISTQRKDSYLKHVPAQPKLVSESEKLLTG